MNHGQLKVPLLKNTPIQDIEKLTDWVKQQKIKKLKRAEDDYKQGL